MGVLQWVLTGEEAHGGYPARCLLLCTVQPCPARPGSARSCPALLINRGIYSPRASGILTDEATARLLHSTLITACKSREVGARPRPHRGAFPRAGGQQCPSVWPQSPGGAQALRRVPGQGRWGLGDSLTCSQGSHHAGQVGQCPAQQGHAQGRAQGHSQVTGQGDGGFSLLLSLWDCPRPQPTWAAPPVSCLRPSPWHLGGCWWCDLHGGGTGWGWPRCDPCQGCGSLGQQHRARSCLAGHCGAGLCAVSSCAAPSTGHIRLTPPARGQPPPCPFREEASRAALGKGWLLPAPLR